ncbi:hypothetical protein HDU67_008010 [Dinochytrium kinnereticum]|nr:hypothetical protein HDU67_008010 [Dinochytrium kinnereticum]
MSRRQDEQIVIVDEEQTIVNASPNATTPLLANTIKRKTSGVRHREQDDDTTSICSATSNSSVDSHMEPHFAGAEIVRDVIVGLSDGLTVPFALAAGLANMNSTQVVVIAGMAEIVAGAISMGLGGYLAGRSEIEHYEAEWKRELIEVATVPEKEEQEIVDIFKPYGMSREDVEPLLTLLRADPHKWVEFMMKFELSLEKPDSNRSWISAITIGFSYFMGGLVPLCPYFFVPDAMVALWISIGTTLFVLLIFGYIKARLLGVPRPLFSAAINNLVSSNFPAVQMMLIGATAAATAFFVAKLISDGSPEYFSQFKAKSS